MAAAPAWVRSGFVVAGVLWSAQALAKPPLGPGSGAGTRRVTTPTAESSTRPAATPAPTPPAPTSHRKGRPPKTPEPRLPAGAAVQAEDTAGRRAIAGDALADAASRGVSDPELVLLRNADRILFPRSLSGFQSGWSWSDLDPSAQAQGLPPVVQALPSATNDDAVVAEWLRSLTLPDFPVRFDERVVQYLKFYRDTKAGKGIAQAWAKKVGRYAPAMQASLSRAGLPKDLVWLSLVESGHNPTAYSPAGAAGMWQFIPESGRMYGLTVDRWVDERLDPERATQAAGAFLGDLYQRFGTWELAMAAYNMGHGALLRSIRKYNTNDFWKLSRYEAGLPWETSLYVPKVFALAIVMNNKRAFGLDAIAQDPAIRFDTVYVEPGVPLDDVAAASGIPVESLRSMNPEYLSGRAPPKSPEGAGARAWPVKLPVGLGTKTASALSRGKHGGQHRPVLVRAGDTLASVAQRWHTTEQALTTLNALRPGERLAPGVVLLVPGAVAPPKVDREAVVVIPSQSVPVPGRKRVFYKVVRGDTTQSVASAFGVTAAELVTWNELDAAAKLHEDMTLQAFVPADRDLSAVRHVTSDATQLLEAGTREFVDYFEGLNGRKRITVAVKDGESLDSIGKRFGLSVGTMERINRMPRTQKLKEGDTVIVYVLQAERGGAEAGKPLAQIEAPRPDALPSLE